MSSTATAVTTAQPQGKLPIGLNLILVYPHEVALQAALAVTEKFGKIVPEAGNATDSATRAYFPEASTKVIFNFASPRMHEMLGKHRAAFALYSDNPTQSGAEAAQFLMDEFGFKTKMFNNLEPEFPEGLISFVSVPEFDGIVFMFWPTPRYLQTLRPEDAERLKKFRIPWAEFLNLKK